MCLRMTHCAFTVSKKSCSALKDFYFFPAKNGASTPIRDVASIHTKERAMTHRFRHGPGLVAAAAMLTTASLAASADTNPIVNGDFADTNSTWHDNRHGR